MEADQPTIVLDDKAIKAALDRSFDVVPDGCQLPTFNMAGSIIFKTFKVVPGESGRCDQLVPKE